MSQGKTFGFLSCALLALWCYTPSISAQGWLELNDETASRFPTSWLNDNEEKDFAWGDIDMDGDDDLVVVRKQPFTSSGRRDNVLLMNEGGNLIDRTALYASASDIAGDNGFLTATNDRDIALVDVDGDGWLDMVTATTLSDGQPKHISHPRIYRNLGNDTGGAWLGFLYEDARIPILGPAGNASTNFEPHSPRFCSVASGDFDADGDMDLYFGDYDSGGGQTFDFNNRMLINDGLGFFSDATDSRLTFQQRDSAFGAATVIADMNGDGAIDIVKQTSLAAPTHVAVTYNSTVNSGFYNDSTFGSGAGYEMVYTQAPYFVTVGDLNNDGLNDMVITDDGADRFMLNLGNGVDGFANFSTTTFSFAPGVASESQFGGNTWIADLDNDGFQDVLLTDVDVDINDCGANDRPRIYHNLGNVPNVTLREEAVTVPFCSGIRAHDVAVFDLNGDGWLDILFGHCQGNRLLMNVPPIPPEPTFTRGDFNNSGSNDITDAIALLGFLFIGAASPACDDAADASDDGLIGLTDALAILNSLFGSPTTPLAAPYPGCGIDPSADGLGCSSPPCL